MNLLIMRRNNGRDPQPGRIQNWLRRKARRCRGAVRALEDSPGSRLMKTSAGERGRGNLVRGIPPTSVEYARPPIDAKSACRARPADLPVFSVSLKRSADLTRSKRRKITARS